MAASAPDDDAGARKGVTRVLFLCTGNAVRSQMAEGWLRHFHADRFEVYSAGTSPHGVDARAVQVMAEAGVDIGAHTSKHVDDLPAVDFDHVITLCSDAENACPTFNASARHLHAGFPDPPRLAADAKDASEELEAFRIVRDAIRMFAEMLPDRLEARES